MNSLLGLSSDGAPHLNPETAGLFNTFCLTSSGGLCSLPLHAMRVAPLTSVLLYQSFAIFLTTALKKDGTFYSYSTVLYHIRAVLAYASRLPRCQGSAEAKEFFSVLADDKKTTWLTRLLMNSQSTPV